MDLVDRISWKKYDNGLRVIHCKTDGEVAYCGMAVNAGTRDQTDTEDGLAHFVEHAVFKGTEKRSAGQIINRLEDVGGDINAYTTKEETFIYATTLSKDFKRAMELVVDMTFNSTFPQKELKMEADVVAEEIDSYRDTPSELIWDEFEGMLFDNRGLGLNILGDKRRVRKYRGEELKDFQQRTWNTDEMVFFSMSNMEWEKVERITDGLLKDVAENRRVYKREVAGEYKTVKCERSMKTHQLHLIVGNRAPKVGCRDYYTMVLLNNITGGPGMNSRLNMALREKSGLAYDVESSYTGYSDGGMWGVYVGAEKRNAERCKEIIDRELTKLADERLSEAVMNKYKRQLMAQQLIANDNHESLILALAKGYLHFNSISSDRELEERVNGISSEMIREMAEREFKDTSVLIFN